MNKILVIAPHADDEVLGCGATIARHASKGDEVHIIVATNASKGAPELFSEQSIKDVREEALKAHEILGVKKTHLLDFPAPALNAYPSFRISMGISEIVSEFKPDTVYLPHPGDMHEDHNAIYRAALVACRPQNENSVKYIYCYETLSETEWSPMQGDHYFKPNHFIDITEYFETKLEAMKCFNSQLKEFPHSRSIEALEALAKFRGSTVGIERAEAFEVERQIIE